MSRPVEHLIQQHALRAAAEIELRPFLSEVLSGALAICGGRTGVILLAGDETHHGVEESVQVVPRGEAHLAGLPGRHELRAIMSDVSERGEWIDSHAAAAEEPAGEETAAFLALPLLAGSRRAGVLLLGGFDESLEGEERLRRGCALVSVLQPFLANVLRVTELEDLVVRDDTAECFNRRYLEEFLTQETARARRYRKPLSLIFLDLDDLKSINSAHGHAAGSRALQEVARRVRGTTRRVDKLFRFGGDEFCVILPETDLHGARRVAERIRHAVAAEAMLEEDLTEGVTLTVSLGIAAFPLHASTGEEMIAAADAAMRRTKASGKNAFSIATPQVAPHAAAEGGRPSHDTGTGR